MYWRFSAGFRVFSPFYSAAQMSADRIKCYPLLTPSSVNTQESKPNMADAKRRLKPIYTRHGSRLKALLSPREKTLLLTYFKSWENSRRLDSNVWKSDMVNWVGWPI